MFAEVVDMALRDDYERRGILTRVRVISMSPDVSKIEVFYEIRGAFTTFVENWKIRNLPISYNTQYFSPKENGTCSV